MKRAIVCLCLALFAVAPLRAGAVKVGIVQVAKLLAEYPEAKAAHAQLQKDAAERQKQLVVLSNELEKLAKEYKAHEKTWTADQLKEKKYVLQKKDEDYEALRSKASSEIESMQDQAGKEVYEKLKLVIIQTAKDEGIDLVLDSDQAIYAKDSVDLTDKILAKFAKVKDKEK